MDAMQATETLHPAVVHVIYYLTEALTAFIQQDSYLYWPYSVSTVLLAFWLNKQGFFSRALWWHPSTRQDYQLYFANFIIGPALLGLLWVNEASVIAALDTVLGNSASLRSADVSAGAASTTTAPNATLLVGIRLLYTLMIFIAYDLGKFLSHYALHRLPALWEIHKVHHSAVVMTPMTAYRLHPFEIVIMSATPVLLTGATTWVFNRALGADISVYTLLGLHVILALLSFIDNLRHSPVWISYGQRLNRWIISPAHHQLHHSREERHWGCNMGFSLAIWDRLAGSLIVPADKPETFRVGLDEASDPKYTGLMSLYVRPVVDAGKHLFKIKGR
jgi:sterol desaturase/sphingolipid hydroxylase (fatty acid hydroxylase superfamily)